MQHGFLLLWDWLLSPEHVVHYCHLSHELWNDISYSADNFQDLLQDRNWFSLVAKEVYVPGVMPGMLSDSVAMDSFLLLEQSSVVMSEVFWLLLQGFCVLFLSMCLCKLQIRAGCSELLQLKSMSLAWCVLHLEEVLEGLVFLWLPWATQEHRCLTQCWVSLSKQNAASWALSMFCVLKQFLRVSCR